MKHDNACWHPVGVPDHGSEFKFTKVIPDGKASEPLQVDDDATTLYFVGDGSLKGCSCAAYCSPGAQPAI